MSWLNPAAFAGLLAVAVPILAHLFGRRSARRQRFPSLRLLRDARATPATRSRPSDILLLVLRCGALVAAVLGLAQPLWLNPERARDALVPARVIIVDTSASMGRLTSDETTAVARARALADRMLDSAREGFVVETGLPGASVAGATSWLQSRSGVRELVVISDFQAGAVQEGQLASVPPGIGVRLEKVPVVVAPGATTSEAPEALAGPVRLAVQANRTDAAWTIGSPDAAQQFDVLAPPEDRTMIEASIAAVHAIAPRHGAAQRRVAVVFPRYATRRDLVAGAAALTSAWQGDLLLAIAGDRVLAATTGSTPVTPACERGGTPIAHNAAGDVVATMAGGPPGTRYDAIIFTCVEAGGAAGTAVLASVAAALPSMPSFREMEPVIVPDETLQGWAQPPAVPGPRSRQDTSADGRWFWLLAVAFLLLEEWLRRRVPRRSASMVMETTHERVA